MSRVIALMSLVLILGLVNWFIAGKEKHLAEGKAVYLQLAPVDPRSLIQADYMALRFGLAGEIRKALAKMPLQPRMHYELEASDGHAVIRLDDRNVGSFTRLHNKQALSENEILMKYRVRKGEVKLATNAFFFQEGHAPYYQSARYGQFRVDDDGELLLAAMYGSDLKELGAPKNVEN